ncbi:MAG: sugar phosphate isomerase/epimerase [Planctomycetes bacterium]|nr:sugar phosphate isomerase/epimerase [Planctomycetota bacterium]
MVKIGYNSNGFTSHRLDEALYLLADCGYQAVAITPDVCHLDPRSTDIQELQRIAGLCNRLNLEVIIESGARYILDSKRKHRPNLLEVDESKMLRLRFLQQMLEWCDIFSAQTLSFWSGVLPAEQNSNQAEHNFLEAIHSLSSSASKNLKLAIEPEPGHLVANLSDWQKLKPQLPPNAGLCLDVGHLLVNDKYSPAEAIELFKEDIVAVQLDDMPRGEHRHCAPGEGDIDWPALVRACEQHLSPDITACFELSRDSHRFHQLVSSCSELYNNLR